MDHPYIYKPSNYNRVINNPRFLSHVADRISTILKRAVTINEKLYVKNFVSKLNPAIFKGKDLPEISYTLSNTIAGKIKTHSCEEKHVDMREYSRREIGISGESDALKFETPSGETPSYNQISISTGTSVNVTSVMGATSEHGIQKLINPLALHKRNYFVLDSRYRTLDNDGTKYLAWNHVNNVTKAQGTVNTIGVLRDIVEMKVYPIRLPYNQTAENDFKRVTMLVEEFSAQSFIGHENRRFHFVFDVEVEGDWIRLNPYYHNNGVFRFNKPITQFDTVRITFGSPLNSIVLDTDRLNASNTYVSTAVLTTVVNHKLSSGNSIVIEDFNTNSPVNDAVVIALMNTTHIITKTGATTFTIPVDTSSIVTVLTGSIDVVNNSDLVVGTATQFLTELKVNDIMKIKGVSYTISAIADNLNLTLSTVYADITETVASPNFTKDNSITGLSYSVYFNSKRLFVPMELTYIQPYE